MQAGMDTVQRRTAFEKRIEFILTEKYDSPGLLRNSRPKER
jgi:hypothetical protein